MLDLLYIRFAKTHNKTIFNLYHDSFIVHPPLDQIRVLHSHNFDISFATPQSAILEFLDKENNDYLS